ncbi:MAG TPA: class I SAM-dependent methyltransferase [Nitrospiraceae bacterium]|nr:class I SAM-dependent methyltransferase [Nitrospiraceae bacterium]
MRYRRSSKLKQWMSSGLFSLLAWFAILSIGTACAPHEHRHQHRLPNVTEYLDRLDRAERDVDQKPAEVIHALDLKPGMAVADLGSGSGYFTRRFRERVAPGGMVYAIDVEPKALEYIQTHLGPAERPASGITFIHADPDESKLAPESVDLLFLCNTYHHIENRSRYFSRAARAIRPGGRLAIIDFYADRRSGELGFPKDHLISREQVIDELTRAGYRLAREHTFLPRQYFLEFDPSPSRR